MSFDSVDMIGDVLYKARNDASTWLVHRHILHQKDESKIQTEVVANRGLTLHLLWGKPINETFYKFSSVCV